MNDAFRRLCWFYRLPNWNCSQMPFENSHHFILMNEAICSRPSHYWNQPWPIINLIAHYQVIITLVRHKKARFDRNMHGSTPKSPVRYNNALPNMHQLTLPLSNILPFLLKLFSIFNQTLCFKEPIHKFENNYHCQNSSEPPCCQGFTMHSTDMKGVYAFARGQ